MARQHPADGFKRWLMACATLASVSMLASSCASGDSSTDDPGTDTPVPAGQGGSSGSSAGGGAGKGGTAGTGGKSAAGSSGTAGTGGSTAGSSGTAGKGGVAGTAGAAGTTGGAGGTTGGSGGTTGGAAGKAGGTTTGGTGGTTGGAAGESGKGGSSGVAGSGAAGQAGIGGSGNCADQPEICDGLDNNCNGVKDEGNPGGGEPCTVPNKVGECAFGTTQCAKTGKIDCVQNVPMGMEICDGKDNNCDGQIDNNPTDVSGTCNTGLKGLCSKGTMQCVKGKATCVQDVQPSAETCNGFDDDCDGVVDNGFSGAGMDCMVAGLQGPCALGQTNCMGGQNNCSQVVMPAPETCNGKDDDCNGTIDDPDAVNGHTCDTMLQGECAFGLTECNAGTEKCNPKVQPGAVIETCNGKDDDCDGTIDNVANIKLECIKKYPSGGNVQNWQCTTGDCEVAACASNYKDCDGSPANGCEINVTTDIGNCGGCGQLCNATNGAPSCIAGQCGISCSAGFGNCDGQAGNGCEQPLNDDVNNCGGCGKVCDQTNGAAACVGGVCKITCDPGSGDCDKDVSNGCEIDTTSSITNCGGCNKACNTTNANVACNAGVCAITSCKKGFADCNNDPSDGCETNTKTDTDNCGACDTVCSNAHGVGSCANGICGISCAAGFGDCDGTDSNGCEVNTNLDSANCGGCGKACDQTNGTATCNGGTCKIVCKAGFGDCDGNPNNGCEVDFSKDAFNCNGCGKICNDTNGTATCVGSVCKVTCDAGFGDCNNKASDGCETTTSNNTQNCGTCGNICSAANGGSACSGGKCSITSCNLGTADCDGQVGNGCEVNTTNNPANCGSCGTACQAVNGGNVCTASACVPSCNAGFGNCDGNVNNGCETNKLSDAQNCGACGTICTTNNASATACANGSCKPTCKAGFGDCDNNGTNGCETNTTSDANNCGSCGMKCNLPNAVSACSGSGCIIISCTAGFADCDGNPANGCEVNLTTDPNHCGACPNVCSKTNGTSSCSSGNCGITCNAGFGNCDGSAANGCETNLTNDVNNCNGCGAKCTNGANATSMVCSGAACKVNTCAADFFDIDTQPSNGCECKQDAVPNTCGSALDLGQSYTIGTGGSFSYNLTPGVNDEDWFKIGFPAQASCSYHPRVTLTAGSLPIKMQIFDGCGGSGIACGEGGTSASNIGSWEYINSTTCGGGQAIDPNPQTVGTYIQTPQVIYVRVYQTGADATKSCLPYTLTVAN
jgi:hypothetical protein